jgi:hypothetical protein
MAGRSTRSLDIMYKVVLSCGDVPPGAGADAAADITREFAEHHTWHKNVSCTWDGSRLILSAENDYDPDGVALMDEFSDCISAYIAEPFDGEIRLELVAT